MISPINEHTVPWPADVAKRYVADGYWAGIATVSYTHLTLQPIYSV